MFDVVFSTFSKKQFLKLPKDLQERMKHVLERARVRPLQHFVRLVGSNSYKLRVGDYRIIADIFQEQVLILVLELGHRKNIYKRRK